jgi:hypothetical protein
MTTPGARPGGQAGRSADDLMLTALVHDIEDRIHSLELIAEKVAGGLASAGK